MKKIFLLFCSIVLLNFYSYAQTWHKLGNGIGLYNMGVNCLKEIDSVLYIGGPFTINGGAIGNAICSFDGQKIDSMPPSNCFTSSVNAIEKFQNKIYVGGTFNSLCNNYNYKNIARWDGSKWDSLNPKTPNYEVNALLVKDSSLYVAGGFYTIGNLPYHRIAKYDGTNWSDVGGGIATTGPFEINAMTIYNGKLVAGGLFGKIGNVEAYCVAQWDGTTWAPIGGGFFDYVFALYTDTINNLLYAGGNFLAIDSTIPARCFACWDGVKWSPVANSYNRYPIPGGVRTITKFNNKLYVGGICSSTPCSSQDTVLATWDGVKWEKVPGPVGSILSLTDYKGNLYVGGQYSINIAGTMAQHIACYGDSCPENVGIKEQPTEKTEYLGQNIPNPFNNTTVIPYYVPPGSKGFLQITDAKGELVDEYALQQGKNKLEVSMKEFKKGVYFYSLVLDGAVKGSRKMVVK